MPRYGPGQSGPAPKRQRPRPPAVPAATAPRTTRADVRATTTVPSAPRQQTRPRQAAAAHLSEHGYEAQARPRVRGMIASGNIDLNKRPIVRNRDGSYSTVRSISVGVGKHTVLIPTVVGRRVVSNEQAFNYFKRTGQHLGIFDTYENADRYAETLHEAQAREYGQRADASPDTGVRTTSADIKATTTVKPARPKTPAQGGAVLARGTFQPSNRKQQAELAKGVRGNAAEQQHRQRQQKLKVAYQRATYLREQARQAGAGKTVALLDQRLTAMEPHLEAAGLTPKPSKFLDSAYGAVQRAEKIPVAGELLGMVDPILAAKTAISNAKALPDIGTKKFGKGQINAGVAFGKGGEFAKGGEEAGGLKAISAEAKPAVPQEDVAAAKVRASLGPARARRAAQEGLYREERGKRIGRAQSASERAGGGEAGFAAAKAELRGELPKVQFKHLREGNLSQGEFENLLTTVQNHPGLRWYDKIHAQQGLADAFREMKTPQKSQIKHLQTVFGDDAAKEIVKASRRAKVGKAAMGVLNIPRSLMASFDLSAPFRQGLVAGVSHPGIFFKNFAPMVRAAGSENFYRAMTDSIEKRPNADLYHESGLKLTDLSKDAGHREEQFPTEYAEKLNVPVGGGHSVGPGHVVRASGRAYTGFLNKMRADMFDHLFEVARKKGVNVEDRKFQRALSSYINSATGRGSLGPAEHMGPALNTFFFSPRLMASRINFMDPTWYMRKSGVGESPFVRKQALKSAGKLAAFGTGVGLAGAAAGGKIGYDPRSSDFGKVKFGNTRLDPLGGFSQYAVAASRIASGKSISSTTGQVSKLGPGLAQLSRKDIVERFFAGKATPTVSFVYDLLQSKDFQGQPLSIKNEVLNRVIPLAIQDAYSLEQDTKNIPLGAAGYVASGLGIGLQTYGPKKLQPNTGKFHAKRQEYLDAAKKVGLAPKDASHLPSGIRQAFALRESREIAYAKAGGHTLDQRGRFAVDMQLLVKMKKLTPKQAAEGSAWAKKASDKDIATSRRLLGNRYFATLYLENATRQINLHGGNVSLR